MKWAGVYVYVCAREYVAKNSLPSERARFLEKQVLGMRCSEKEKCLKGQSVCSFSQNVNKVNGDGK